ncbi:MAG: hypothetical protein J5877_00230 [Clostridia bacterium]|nr:hypothetical protein [Clostridia bacterium]
MNMDLKALIAKITGKNKEASAGTAKKKNNSVSAFFEKNPTMKYVIAVIAVVIAVAVAATIILSSKKSKPDLDTNVSVNANDAVEVLPQIERDRGGEYEGKDPFVENILDGAKLTGIYETYGYKSATLQTTLKSYTLYEGDTVGDSDWVVSEITDKSITLVSGDKTKTFSK